MPITLAKRGVECFPAAGLKSEIALHSINFVFEVVSYHVFLIVPRACLDNMSASACLS